LKKSLLGNYVYDAASSLCAKLNGACGQREQGVILATANVHSRVEVGAALANQDFAGVYSLAIVALYTKTLSVRVTTVACGANSLFGCHFCLPT
jgi:hypothetical protein